MMRSPLDSPLEESGMEGALERQQRESGAMRFPGMGGHAGRELSLGEDGSEGDGEVEAGEMRLPVSPVFSLNLVPSCFREARALC